MVCIDVLKFKVIVERSLRRDEFGIRFSPPWWLVLRFFSPDIAVFLFFLLLSEDYDAHLGGKISLQRCSDGLDTMEMFF